MTTHTTAIAPLPSLTAEEVARFHHDGYLAPVTLCSPAAMAAIRERIFAEVFTSQGPCTGDSGHGRVQSRHLDQRVVYDLCTHPAIIGRARSLLGDDIVLWRSNFFDKPTGGKSVPWHQDFNYWPLDPLVNLSAWIAITPSVLANSCVHVIPGSHRRILPHVPADKAVNMFDEQADPAQVPVARKVPIELLPGQCMLFNERTLHWSAANSGERRCGLAVRLTVPLVKVFHDELFPGHVNVVVSGSDSLGKNRLGMAPAR
jgi:hypothetical protein